MLLIDLNNLEICCKYTIEEYESVNSISFSSDGYLICFEYLYIIFIIFLFFIIKFYFKINYLVIKDQNKSIFFNIFFQFTLFEKKTKNQNSNK